MTEKRFKVSDMMCSACSAAVERCVRALDGAADVSVSLLAGEMTVSFDETRLTAESICRAVTDAGFPTEIQHARTPSAEPPKSEFTAKRLLLSVIFTVALMVLSMGHILGLPLPAFLTGSGIVYAAAIQMVLAAIVMLINRRYFIGGVQAVLRRAPNMDTLIALGASASFLYGVATLIQIITHIGSDPAAAHAYMENLYFESAAMIPTLITLGKTLEARARKRTTGAIRLLMELSPKEATLLVDGAEKKVPTADIRVGDVLVIRPGGGVPVDAEIVSGEASVDESSLTGESMPVPKGGGDALLSGSMVLDGVLHARATKVGEDTTLAQIIRLVSDAGASKAPVARLADKISGIFVPIVVTLSLLTLGVWLLFGDSAEHAIRCAVSVLVISCPCALGLATPVAITVGTGRGASLGVLIKSGEALETLGRAQVVLLDKTGTITEGKPAVSGIYPFSGTEDTLLTVAAGLENGSEHPLARAVLEKATARGIAPPDVTDFRSRPGRGISARLDGKTALAGNVTFLKEEGIDIHAASPLIEEHTQNGETPMLVACDGALIGALFAADKIKEDSREAVDRLRALGCDVIMLTGDSEASANAVAQKVGISTVRAGLLPTGKEREIRALTEKQVTVMVGDGINDAPALALASASVAIGAGTEIAKETADCVLVGGRLTSVADAILLSRAVMKNIRENLFWAFFYNVLGIPVAAGVLFPALGILLNPMIAAACMSVSSLFVVTNALRLTLFGRKNERR